MPHRAEIYCYNRRVFAFVILQGAPLSAEELETFRHEARQANPKIFGEISIFSRQHPERPHLHFLAIWPKGVNVTIRDLGAFIEQAMPRTCTFEFHTTVDDQKLMAAVVFLGRLSTQTK